MELIVVMAVLAVLASTVVPMVSKMIDRSRVSRTAVELTTIANAMNMYLADTGSYPPWVGVVNVAWGADVGLVERSNVVGGHLASWNGPYLKEWPIKTAWGGPVGCGATGAYYVHTNIGWIDRDGLGGNDRWIHMNPSCVRYPPQMAREPGAGEKSLPPLLSSQRLHFHSRRQFLARRFIRSNSLTQPDRTGILFLDVHQAILYVLCHMKLMGEARLAGDGWAKWG